MLVSAQGDGDINIIWLCIGQVQAGSETVIKRRLMLLKYGNKV